MIGTVSVEGNEEGAWYVTSVQNTLFQLQHSTEHTLPATALYRTHSSSYNTVPNTLFQLQHCTEHTLPATTLYRTHSSSYKTVPNTLFQLQHCTEHTLLATTLYRTHSSSYNTLPNTPFQLQHCTEHPLPATTLYRTHSSSYNTVPNTLFQLQHFTEHTLPATTLYRTHSSSYNKFLSDLWKKKTCILIKITLYSVRHKKRRGRLKHSVLLSVYGDYWWVIWARNVNFWVHVINLHKDLVQNIYNRRFGIRSTFVVATGFHGLCIINCKADENAERWGYIGQT